MALYTRGLGVSMALLGVEYGVVKRWVLKTGVTIIELLMFAS